MTGLLYTLKKGDYVIKRVSSNESYKAPKESMQFRQTLIEPIVKVKKPDTSKDKVEPPGYLVRAKSALHKSRLISEYPLLGNYNEDINLTKLSAAVIFTPLFSYVNLCFFISINYAN